MLSKAPQFPVIADDIRGLLRDTVCVAHNAPFDTGFISATCTRYGISDPDYGPIIDTVKLARRHFGFPSCSLRNLTERMNLPLDNHHRALSDAYATYLLFQTMMKTIDPGRQLSVGELLTRTESLSPKGLARQAMKHQLREAVRSNLDVEIDYTRVRGPGDLTSTRRLSGISVDFPKVKAWCHLRNDERVFWIDRIHRVELLEANLQAQPANYGA
jgi:DNA polymerase III epsilon subunit-like protein